MGFDSVRWQLLELVPENKVGYWVIHRANSKPANMLYNHVNLHRLSDHEKITSNYVEVIQMTSHPENS